MAATKGMPAAAVLANGISRHAFTSEPVIAPDADEVFDVPMTIADALGIGWSLQAHAIQGRMPPATAAIYRRIGERMVKLAKAEMQKRVEAAAASGAKARAAK